MAAGTSKGSSASQAGLAPLGTTKEVLGFIIDFLDFDLDFLGSPRIFTKTFLTSYDFLGRPGTSWDFLGGPRRS